MKKPHIFFLILLTFNVLFSKSFAADTGPVVVSQTTGGDELFKADVFLSNGKFRLGVDVGNFPSSFGVTQVTSPWVISGTVGRSWTLLNTTDSVNIGNFPATQAITCALCSTESTLSTINGKLNTLGQKTSANSAPVVLSSDQPSIPVVASVSDTSASGSITALDTGTSALTGANGQVVYVGTATTNSAAVFALASIQNVSVQVNILGAGGTIVVEISKDGGTSWVRPGVFQDSTQIYSNAFTSSFIGILNTTGATQLRVRSTSSWSGSASVVVKESINSRMMTIGDALPPGGNAIGSVAVTSSVCALCSTSANQTTEIASVQILDDVPAAQNGAFVKGDTIMGQLDDTSSTAATEDNVAAVRITAARALHLNLRNNAGTEVGTSGAPIRIDPTGTTSQPVTQGTANTAANGWPIKVTDGTNTATVKAASTAPVGSDTAIVVVESPNGNQATATNQTTEITNLGNIQTSVQLLDNTVGPVAAGTAATNSILTGCVYTSGGIALTNAQQAACQMDKSANIIVTNIPVDGTKTTYSAAVSGFNPAGTATDVFVIKGSATKTVRILHISLSGTTTSGGGITVNVGVIKRSVADTAGTSTTMTNVPNDSADGAATAVVQAYTANPTLGATVGNVRTARVAFPAAGLFASSGMESGFDFGMGPEKAVVLRGTAEQLAINLGGTTITGGILSAYVEWTEE